MDAIATRTEDRPSELDRVLALPWVDYDGKQERLSNIAADRIKSADRAMPPLRDAQWAFFRALAHAAKAPPGNWGARGAVGMLGCGDGKTICAQLAPRILGSQSPLLVLPASLQKQLDADIDKWGDAFRLVDPPRLTYGKLSTKGGTDLLFSLKPDLIIFDEAHLVSNPKSARWKRVARYLTANTHCRVVVLSGTLTWAGLREMNHLLFAALRDWCPLPQDSTLNHWAAVMDVGGVPGADDWGMVEDLIGCNMDTIVPGVWDRAIALEKAIARRAFQRRLSTAPGVVVSTGSCADVALRMTRYVSPLPRAVETALKRLDEKWELPDSTELVDALEFARHARTISLGFYSRWVEPVNEEWLAARKRWQSQARHAVEYGNFDSIGAVGEWCSMPPARTDHRLVVAWAGWKALREGTLAPETETIWLDGAEGWLVDMTIAFHDKHPAGLFWYQSKALGELLRHCMPIHGQGAPPPQGHTAAVAMGVFAKGWNAQHDYHANFILEPPSSGRRWEQLLARTHRHGQTRDVHAWVLQATPHQVKALRQGFAGAHYAHETTGAPQRLLVADWEDGTAPQPMKPGESSVFVDDGWQV